MGDRSVDELLSAVPGQAKPSAGGAGDRTVDQLLADVPKEGGPSKLESAARGAARGLTFEVGPKIEGAIQAVGQKILPDSWGGSSSKKPLADLFREGVAGARLTDKRAEDANPDDYLAGNIGGNLLSSVLVPGGAGLAGAAKTGAIVGGLSAFGNSDSEGSKSTADTALGAGAGAIIGAGTHGLLRGGGAALGALGRKLLPKAQAFEGRAATALGDLASKDAFKTAAAAKGTAGAAVAEGSRALERLAMDAGLPAADQAANRAALATPEAQQLASDLAAKARTKLPDQLAHIDTSKALAQQTAQDALAAQAKGQTVDYAKDALKQRVLGQAKRYAIPLAGGVVGGLTGDDEGFNWMHAGLGAAAGRGVSPGVRAVMGTVSNPATKRLVGAGFVSMAEKLAGLAKSNPAALGKFAQPLASAAARGTDALAAWHYALSTDPEYQELQRHASLEETP